MRHFTRSCSARTRGNSFKLKEGGFKLDIRETFFNYIRDGEILEQVAAVV